MTSATKKRKAWSYSVGERGKNRVRAFERASDGRLFVEWYVPMPGSMRPKVERQMLATRDTDRAKAAAEELAAKLRSAVPVGLEVLTLGALFDNYLREVSAAKGESKGQHDDRAAKLFCECFGRGREVRTLSVRDWNRFIQLRRSGALAPRGARKSEKDKGAEKPKPVRDRVIAYDLKMLRAAVKWATIAGDGRGGTLLDRNPLDGLPLPREESPRRPILTAEQYKAMHTAAAEVSPQLRLALVLAHETGHRIGAIRTLRWSDVDLKRGVIRWRAENDKIGFEHTPVMSAACVAALKKARRGASTIGDAWVFPSPTDPAEPCSRHLLRDWWERAAEQAKLPKGQRLGWHALRRKFATELKDTPLRDLCYLGGWRSPTTILTCYQQPDEDTQRAALSRRRAVRVGGGN